MTVMVQEILFKWTGRVAVNFSTQYGQYTGLLRLEKVLTN